MAAGSSPKDPLDQLVGGVLSLSLQINGPTGFRSKDPDVLHEWASQLRATYVELIQSAKTPPEALEETGRELSEYHQRILTDPIIAHSVQVEGQMEDRLWHVANELPGLFLPGIARSIERAFGWPVAEFPDPPYLLPEDYLSVVLVASEATPQTLSITFELFDFAETSGDGRLSLPERKAQWLPYLREELEPACVSVRLASILFQHDQDHKATCRWLGPYHRLVVNLELDPEGSI